MGKVAGMGALPADGGLEAGAPVQYRRVAATAVPSGGGVLDLLSRQVPRTVFFEPAFQLWPGAEQRLVCDLDRILAAGEQAAADVGAEHGLGGGVRGQVGASDWAAGVAGSAGADFDQAQEHHLRLALPCLVQPSVDTVSRLGDGVVNAPGRPVAVDGERGAVALRPGGPQRIREQRQPPGVVVRGRLARCLGHPAIAGGPQVCEEQLSQTGFDLQASRLRRVDDRLPQLFRGHRPNHDLVSLKRTAELGVTRQALGIEVSAQPARHHRQWSVRLARVADPPEPGNELCPLALALAEREQFLELVNHQHDPDSRPAGRGSGLRQTAQQGVKVFSDRVQRQPRRVRLRSGQRFCQLV